MPRTELSSEARTHEVARYIVYELVLWDASVLGLIWWCRGQCHRPQWAQVCSARDLMLTRLEVKLEPDCVCTENCVLFVSQTLLASLRRPVRFALLYSSYAVVGGRCSAFWSAGQAQCASGTVFVS